MTWDNFVLGTERLYMRLLTLEDATERYVSWRNDKEVTRWLEPTKKHETVEDVRAFIKAKIDNPDCLFFGIFIRGSNLHIGNVKLEPIMFLKKKAIVGIMIGDREQWGKGYATEALKELFKFCFYYLDLNTVELGVQADNTRAIHAYEKAGMKKVDSYIAEYSGVKFENVIMKINRWY